MAGQTSKRNLYKPERTDFVNVMTDISNNMENLDNAVPDSRKVNGHSLSDDVTVTKSDVGLGNADNTSDANKPVSTAQQAALDMKLNVSQKGAAGGLAELDDSGKVPSSQLPSYVDDIVNGYRYKAEGESDYRFYANEEHTVLIVPEDGKIYVDLHTNLPYRWSGETYVGTFNPLGLGETSSTAHRGDHGKAAYDHAMAHGNAFASGLYKVTTNSEGHVTAAVPATKEDIGLGNVDNTSDADKPVSTAQQQAVQDSEAAAQRAEDARDAVLDMTVSAHALAPGATPTATFAQGNMEFGIPQGYPGGNVILDDTAGEGDTDKVWSADKITEELNHVSVDEMEGATSQAAGKAGLVPAPAIGDQDKVLKGDGTWGTAGLDPSDIANNLTTETAGKVLDARQGKVLKDMVDAVVASTLRTIPFSIPVANWTLSGGYYTATVVSAFITASSKEMVTYDGSLRTAFKGDMNVEKTSGGGSLTFTTNELPVGAVNGTIYCVDSDDGKISVVLQDTVMPIANGGTGAQTAAGARTNLGAASQTDMTAAQGDISDLGTELASVESGLAYKEDGATASRNINKDEFVFWQGVTYRASTDIASGETLAVGTNLTAETAVLNEFNRLKIYKRLLQVYQPSTASVVSYSFSEPVTNFMFILVTGSWNSLEKPTAYIFTPSWKWNSIEPIYLYLNQNPANAYANITSRNTNGLTAIASNTSVSFEVYGIGRIAEST